MDQKPTFPMNQFFILIPGYEKETGRYKIASKLSFPRASLGKKRASVTVSVTWRDVQAWLWCFESPVESRRNHDGNAHGNVTEKKD